MQDFRPNSRANTFRQRRVQLINQITNIVYSENHHVNIIDVGGTHKFWENFSIFLDKKFSFNIDCINLSFNESNNITINKNVSVNVSSGNACELNNVYDKQYDIAFSNSVIEHVGSWYNMELMASEVKRVARNYIVQTPYFWFPIEPHVGFPFVHWLPEQLFYRLVMKTNLRFAKKQNNVADAMRIVQDAKMLGKQQFTSLFAEARILKERWWYMTKALIAVKMENDKEETICW